MHTSCSGGGKKKETKLGLAHSKADDFGGWYSEVCTESELISYYAVSGKSQLSCYIAHVAGFVLTTISMSCYKLYA